jgi:curved DNA-binding protein CbpA
MTERDPKFDAYVMKIYRALNRLDYYRLLGAAPSASSADIKKTFYAIAKKFHPDRNRNASPEVARALYDIYKRITEAYRVLQSDEKRKRYNETLKEGHVRLEQDMRVSLTPKDPADTITDKTAREFYIKAREALDAQNVLQADLHIKMAIRRVPDNKAVRTLVGRILQAKTGRHPA